MAFKTATANDVAATAGAALEEEEDVTKDDLQAMKDMIGDIKKDPSLLYRLSSLPGGNNAKNADANAAVPNRERGTNGTSAARKIFLDDDATEVSSLGMMSSGDYATRRASSSRGGDGGRPRASPLASGKHRSVASSSGRGGSSAAYGLPSPARTGAATAQSRTNHDAEIALRMQSLRAKRGFSQPQRPSPSRAAGASQTVLTPPKRMTTGANGGGEDDATAPSPRPPYMASDPSEPASRRKFEGRMSSSGSGGGASVKSQRSRSGPPSAGRADGRKNSRSRSGHKRREKSKFANGDGTDDAAALASNSERTGKGADENHGGRSDGRGDYPADPPSSATEAAKPPVQSHRSAASRYAVDKFFSGRPDVAEGRQQQQQKQQQQQQQQQGESGKQMMPSSEISSSDRRSRKQGSGRKLERRRLSQSGAAPKISTLSKNPDTKLRSRSELPRRAGDAAIPEERSRGSSEQPKDREEQGSSELRAKGRSSRRSKKDRSSYCGNMQTVETEAERHLRRRGRRNTKHQDEPQLSDRDRSANASNTSGTLDKTSLIEILRADQKQTSNMASELAKRSSDETDEQSQRDQTSHMPDESRNVRANGHEASCREEFPDTNARKLSGELQQQEEMGMADQRQLELQRHDTYGESGDWVGSLPVSMARENSRHSNGHHGHKKESFSTDSSPSTAAAVAPPVGHNLSQLVRLDRQLPRRPSIESESGKSVTSRLSQLRRRGRMKTSRRSVGSTYVSNDLSPMRPTGSEGSVGGIAHDQGKDFSQSFQKGLRRMSQFSGASPRVGARGGEGATAVSSDFLEKSDGRTDRTQVDSQSYLVTNDNSNHVTLGIELAIRSGQVPRLCDERGRCLFHPHIRLQKPKLFGGWKILFQHCPDCAVEHMKKTQEELIAVQKEQRDKKERGAHREASRQKKKKKHKRIKDKGKPDPMIGKNVGDKDFTEERKPTKKKRDRKKKEKLREELAVSSSGLMAGSDKPEEGQQVQDDGIKQQQQHLIPKEEEASISEQHTPQQQHQSQTNDQPQTKQSVPPSPSNPSQDQALSLVPRKKPKPKKVNGLPWSDYNGRSGRYTGEVNDQYLPHGKGEMVYDRGSISSGLWYNGVLDTEDDDRGGASRRSRHPTTSEEPPETLPNYAVGDKGKNSDMIIAPKAETAALVAQIRVKDAAWVRRSNGSWTYAIVKDRTPGNDQHDENGTIRFKVNLRGSTKAFPTSQWGTYVRRIRRPASAPDAPAPNASGRSLGNFLDMKNASARTSGANSLAGGMVRHSGGDSVVSVDSARSAPLTRNLGSMHNLTTGKMNMRSRSRSRSRNRKNVTTLPLLFSSSMSVSEENEGHANDDWETASGSGYRLRGIDP